MALDQSALRSGAKVRRVPLYADSFSTSADQMAAALSREIIACVTPRVYGVDCARFAPSLLTSPADVDASIKAVHELA